MARRRLRHGRRAAREAAMRLIYEADLGAVQLATLFEDRRDQLGLDSESRAYAEWIVEHVGRCRAALDAAIAAVAPAWPVDQMARLDVAILRIAIAEIDAGDVPPPVAVSEAVELAKRYCSEGSRRMINGALGAYIRQDVK